MAGFFGLPREIRDMIYRHYVAVEGGYLCDTEGFVKGRLRRADGGQVDMALIFTCRQVAKEMHGLALRKNSITFSTLSGDDYLRLLAQTFDYLSKSLDSHRWAMFLGMLGEHMTQEARN
ncbi:uncharacterized protein LY79DRAFT_672364 [Colletotrichum navitas]|uniref:Uncharacterized protein n=1 Tax=Colletotrichum navitas TaxID=681940 RepID=A0AAD8PS04_9PEZI|nr:uncharacterized protein LY79DRAFT_672364 [Colletotrichum navitas]KAK1579566.1 hypothetical protein LY79DRAFT_672364 [Colletotrichum navitas]